MRCGIFRKDDVIQIDATIKFLWNKKKTHVKLYINRLNLHTASVTSVKIFKIIQMMHKINFQNKKCE